MVGLPGLNAPSKTKCTDVSTSCNLRQFIYMPKKKIGKVQSDVHQCFDGSSVGVCTRNIQWNKQELI